MTAPPPWVNDANAALLTDLYQLTMLEAYLEAAMFDEAVFDLFIRRLPQPRIIPKVGERARGSDVRRKWRS